MADTEPPAGSDDSDSSGGLSAFLNSTPKMISGIAALIGAVTGLVIALNKAGVLGSDNAASTLSTTQTGGTTTDASTSLFGPKTQGGGDGRVWVENGTLYINARERQHGVRVLADQENPPPDVSLSSSVKWVSGERDWSFSVLCRFRDSRNFYLLGVIPPKRLYNIAMYRDGRLRSLSGLRPSDAIRKDENTVAATCIGSDPTVLSLKVNGETVKTVYVPNGLDSGNVGVRAGSVKGPVTAAFDDLALEPR